MSTFSRRQLLASVSAVSAVAAAPFAKLFSVRSAIAAELEPIALRVVERHIEVGGKPAKVYGLHQPNGTSGIVTSARRFRVRLENHVAEPTLIHWHGLLPPFGQDGVPDLPQPLLAGGQSYDYDFPLDTPGTHWMHAHTLQEQQLLAAPLIVMDPAEASRDEQPIVVLLHDFSFKSPEEILAGLTGASAASHGGSQAMTGHSMPAARPGMAMDINDIEYDAYLANDRTLGDPEAFRVEVGGTVRLRLINGATATAFWIDLGELVGEAIAVDGNQVAPISGRRFPLAMGQRIDIRVRLPKHQGAWPILALREGAVEQTGFLLATPEGRIRRIPSVSAHPTDPLGAEFEGSLRAARSFAEKRPDRRTTITLGGDMANYLWTLDGKVWGQHRPLPARAGERVELTMDNQSMMGHPMHLHGHHFQVVAIDGRRVAGAVRDTVWVPPSRKITIAFDTNNPGLWAFHCHHLYHMATGMMTAVAYET